MVSSGLKILPILKNTYELALLRLGIVFVVMNLKVFEVESRHGQTTSMSRRPNSESLIPSWLQNSGNSDPGTGSDIHILRRRSQAPMIATVVEEHREGRWL